MRHRRHMGDRYDEKRVSDGTNGYYEDGRSDSQRRLNPNVINPDVQLNSPAVPAPATGYDREVFGNDARR